MRHGVVGISLSVTCVGVSMVESVLLAAISTEIDVH